MRKTKIIAEGGMLAALSTVILFMGTIIDALDLSCAVLAGFAVLAMRIRHGRAGSFAVYCVTAVLSFALLPNKVPAVLYVFYGGLYPLLKPEIERIESALLQWILKVSSVMVSFSLGLAFITGILGVESGFTVGLPLYLLLVLVAVAADISISAIVRRYGHIVVFRKR